LIPNQKVNAMDQQVFETTPTPLPCPTLPALEALWQEDSEGANPHCTE